MRLLTTILLLFCTFPVCSMSWTPSAGIAVHYAGTSYTRIADTDTPLRSCPALSLNIEAAAISAGRHRLSMPASVMFIPAGSTEGRTFVQPRMAAAISASYAYALTEKMMLSFSLDASFIWHIRSRAGIWGAGMTVTPAWRAGKNITITFPVSVSFSKGFVLFLAGAGIRFGG